MPQAPPPFPAHRRRRGPHGPPVRRGQRVRTAAAHGEGTGLLERRTGWYARGITVNLLALAAVVTGVALLGGSWWVLLLAPLLALFSTRAAFFGHDAGHAQIAADRRTNRIIQLVHANLLLGMSQEWWNDKHNRHHANPNTWTRTRTSPRTSWSSARSTWPAGPDCAAGSPATRPGCSSR
ncbi:fatty acid desaturase [Streptomyces pristinaespiralis]